MTTILREYIVTLKSRDDLEGFYADMETVGNGEYTPSRAVECIDRRTISRNTHYKLSPSEAKELAKDPRVESITVKTKHWISQHQTADFNKAALPAASQVNWGLYRASQKTNDIPFWGSNSGDGSNDNTVTITGTGKNVDVVICDEILYPDHPEFSGRVVQYDWFAEHNATVWPSNPNSNYAYDNYSQSNNHATTVGSIVAGITQGWAREANIYNFRNDATGYSPSEYTPIEYVIDYIRDWHNNKPINPETGRQNPTIVNNSWGISVAYPDPNINTNGIDISRINFRNSIIEAEDLGNTPVDTGFSGVCGGTVLISAITELRNGGSIITTTGSTTGSVSSTTLNLQGSSGLSDLGTATYVSVDGYDSDDDAVWQIALPFDITYAGVTYGPTAAGTAEEFIHVSSNSAVVFGGNPISGYQVLWAANSPSSRKICVSAYDRSCQKVYGGVEGTAPNRTYRIRWEGHDGAEGGVVGSPTMVWEMTFKEATPNEVELHVGDNAAFRGEFTTAQLAEYGVVQGVSTSPIRDAALDADIADAINDGIIFVSAAGNGGFKCTTAAEIDYNNYYVYNGGIQYYHRGTSPAASHTSMISVGAAGAQTTESRVATSNTGPTVDLYAPGENIMGALYDYTGAQGGLWSNTVNDGSAILSNAIANLSRTSNVVTVETTGLHNLVNGDIVTINCTSDYSFNIANASVTVTSATTFTVNQTGTDVVTTAGTGDIEVGYRYHKASGSSVACAQVTGILALALEQYPNMTQAQAKEYILHYAQNNILNVGANPNSFTDQSTLLQGNNRYVYFHKERPSEGVAYPKARHWLRPSSGAVYPRPKIRRS